LGRHVYDHRDAWEVVRRADHPRIGPALDSFHTLARRLPPDAIRAIPGDRIFLVQLADAPAISMDLLYWSRHFRSMPGDGDLDIVAFMRAVAATGYAGPISLEIFNDQFRSGSPHRVALEGYRSLIQLTDSVRRAEPTLATDLPEFPPPEPVADNTFIEIATSVDAEPALRRFLTASGFSPTAGRVSKNVVRWRQGAINILVNSEPTGFAAEALRMHETNVSEIALEVPDASHAAERATAMRAPVRHTPVRAYNILYDEEGEGRFFQTYSKSSPEGLFFEILERQGGYGAPNAPFRIAAQKRAAKSGGDRWV
jgi:4-hydroxyphenylpyruvate dioxygenase